MKPLLLMTVAACIACTSAEEPQGPAPHPQPPHEHANGPAAPQDGDEQVLTITVPVPADASRAPAGLAVPGLQELIRKGWRVNQATTLGKTADGSAFVVMVVLDQSSAEAVQPAGAAGGGPGAAAPVASAPAGTYHIVWDDGTETVATIGAPPQGVRSPVEVVTSDHAGAREASYQATAFLDAQGELHIDGRGAPLGADQARSYAPDSFAIHGDGTVAISDDAGHDATGVLITTKPGRPGGAQPRRDDGQGKTNL